MRNSRQVGFTLVELLVAMFITAIMFVIGYRALEQTLSSRHQLDEQSARLIAVQQALRIVEQDFELLQPRPVRNLIGDGYLPALISTSPGGLGALNSTLAGNNTANNNTLGNNSTFGGNSGSGTLGGSVALGSSSANGPVIELVTFTRGGWTNPAGIQRSELQRVSYTIENGALMRSYYPVLDATAADTPVKRMLIDHVKNVSLRFMDAGHQWQTAWPVNTTVGTGTQNPSLRWRPVAVEFIIELDDWGVLLRHIEVAG